MSELTGSKLMYNEIREILLKSRKKEKSVDFIKDPYVLEFLDLKDYPAIHESDFEQALISKLQIFLLELGRGFLYRFSILS